MTVCDVCDDCGRIFEVEDLHQLEGFWGRVLLVCDRCDPDAE